MKLRLRHLISALLAAATMAALSSCSSDIAAHSGWPGGGPENTGTAPVQSMPPFSIRSTDTDLHGGDEYYGG